MAKALVLKPDSKGRITLGKLAEGVSSFHVIVDSKTSNITLEPYSEIPMRERWVFQDKKTYISFMKGIEQARAGDVHDLGSFAKHIEE